MTKVYLVWEHWTASYEESDSLHDIYQNYEDAQNVLKKLQSNNVSMYTQYSLQTWVVK
jgi:hypothetical protein